MNGSANPRDRSRSFLSPFCLIRGGKYRRSSAAGEVSEFGHVYEILWNLKALAFRFSMELELLNMTIADNASECLPHVTRYDVEASQGAAASECARAAPDGGSTTLV
ncbi:unnamed protein product [Nippostrongylus brasiliensis]|uniref:Uncharacterized protein n=1 Tax=Nippostrongylus brasiliensis TaxID=27835 RepID=A0A0N4YKA4_NIPBR|nr:unnamed protein product [Nippostrongylus brasiliensis]